MAAIKSSIPRPKQGWHKASTARRLAVIEYLNDVFGYDQDKWSALRFEMLCQFSELLVENTGLNYHHLIALKAFRKAFFYKWLENDFAIAENNIVGDYMELKYDLMCTEEFKTFIISFMNMAK